MRRCSRCRESSGSPHHRPCERSSAGIVSYLVLRELLEPTPSRTAGAEWGCFIAAGLVFGMPLEGWPASQPTVERVALLLATLALAALLAVGLQALATRAMET